MAGLLARKTGEDGSRTGTGIFKANIAHMQVIGVFWIYPWDGVSQRLSAGYRLYVTRSDEGPWGTSIPPVPSRLSAASLRRVGTKLEELDAIGNGSKFFPVEGWRKFLDVIDTRGSASTSIKDGLGADLRRVFRCSGRWRESPETEEVCPGWRSWRPLPPGGA